MTDRQAIARSTAEGLRAFVGRREANPVIVGFDGFIDSIIAVVDKRHDAERYEAIPTISRLAEKIAAAAGKSSNYELVVRLRKLGGNGPIMANAMLEAGLPLTYLGALGVPEPDPVFADFAARTTDCFSFCDAGTTDALEFEDGKLMLGKIETLKEVNWDVMVKTIGLARVVELFSEAKLIGMVNWTMLPYVGDIWEKLNQRILSQRADRPIVFIDLADPEKRTTSDLEHGLCQISAFNTNADVVFGMNLKEAGQVATVLGLEPPSDSNDQIVSAADAIRDKLEVRTVVIHPRRGAGGVRFDGSETTSAWFDGPFVAQPKLSTGAGDNFNGGFCLASLASLPIEQCLCAGAATSGYYVRQAASPTLEQLIEFCDDLPAAEQR